MRDKYGNYLTLKEYMARWKSGIDSITPYQQTNTQLKFTKIVIVGIIGGIIYSIISIKNLWWLLIILVGALGNTAVQLVGLIQKRNILKNIEEVNIQNGKEKPMVRPCEENTESKQRQEFETSIKDSK